MVFPVVIYGCESWTIRKAECLRAVVLGKILESSLNCKIKPVNPKGSQSWIFVGGTATEAETPVLWPPDAKSQFIRKDSDSRKDWREKEKGMTENEMIEWQHGLNGHEFGLALGNGDGQWSRACCSPWVANSWTQQTHDPHLHWYTDHPDRKPIYTALKLLIKSDGLNYYR